MLITITIASILGLTALAWLFGKTLPFRVCPICTGVFLTWVGLVAAHFMGYGINLIVPALLMGGTVVGLAYQLEKKLNSSSAEARLLLKTLFIPIGFISAYGILAEQWTVFLLALIVLLVLSFLFAAKAGTSSANSGMIRSHEEIAEGLEKQMKDCC